MPPDSQAVARLNEQKQYFFLPYYRAVVERHPHGIGSDRVKDLVAHQILDEFGIDIGDAVHSGTYSSGGTRAEQWASNLVSNGVLDHYMLVVHGESRGSRAMLYPGAEDNSRTVVDNGERLTEVEVSELNGRRPLRFEAPGGSSFRRSLQLAEFVREMNGRACVVGRPTCVKFSARDGRPYVEVHHVVPMSVQGQTETNLDRSTNMVPLCPGCHACIHRGHVDAATAILADVFTWFESTHGQSFQDANADLGFGTTASDLLSMYGSEVPPA